MKKIKYLFVFLVTLCFLPNMVSATQSVYYNSYKIGDEIIVTLDEEGKVKGKFRVIEASKEGNETNLPDDWKPNENADYQYVTAIYEETLGESFYTLDENKLTYASSLAHSNLVVNAKDAGWINYKEIRLLTKTDLNTIGASLSSSELKEKYPWLYLSKSYWVGENAFVQTMGGTCDVNGECSSTTTTFAYAFYKNGIEVNRVDAKLSLRPVIKIHKGFVEGGMICNCEDCIEEPTLEKYCPNDSKISIQTCLDNGTTEEECIKKLCPSTEKVENPKTGSYLPLFGIVIASIISSCIYVATRNRNYFTKIK